jgi:hypothetical protein
MNWNESLLADCQRLLLRFSDAAGFIPSCVSKKINQMVKKQTINLPNTRLCGWIFKSLFTDKVNITSASVRLSSCRSPADYLLFSYPVFYQHFIRQRSTDPPAGGRSLADSPVRDLMWVERKLTPIVSKSASWRTLTGQQFPKPVSVVRPDSVLSHKITVSQIF